MVDETAEKVQQWTKEIPETWFRKIEEIVRDDVQLYEISAKLANSIFENARTTDLDAEDEVVVASTCPFNRKLFQTWHIIRQMSRDDENWKPKVEGFLLTNAALGTTEVSECLEVAEHWVRIERSVFISEWLTEL